MRGKLASIYRAIIHFAFLLFHGYNCAQHTTKSNTRFLCTLFTATKRQFHTISTRQWSWSHQNTLIPSLTWFVDGIGVADTYATHCGDPVRYQVMIFYGALFWFYFWTKPKNRCENFQFRSTSLKCYMRSFSIAYIVLIMLIKWCVDRSESEFAAVDEHEHRISQPNNRWFLYSVLKWTPTICIHHQLCTLFWCNAAQIHILCLYSKLKCERND